MNRKNRGFYSGDALFRQKRAGKQACKTIQLLDFSIDLAYTWADIEFTNKLLCSLKALKQFPRDAEDDKKENIVGILEPQLCE
jgi:hypothetical protein